MIKYYVAPGIKDAAAKAKIIPFERAERIERIVTTEYGLTIEQAKKRNRYRKTVECRQIIFYLMAKYTRFSAKAIGKRYGMDHTTILHNIKSLEDLIEVYPDIRSTVTRIEQLYLNAK